MFCSYTPTELILAADAVPVGLCGASEDPISYAEKTLPKNLCPLIKSSYGFAASDTCPYFYFSDLVVGETTCDGKKKMFEWMNEIKPTHVMQLPPGRTSGTALATWHSEMQRLKDVLSRTLQVEITDDNLRQAIHLKNRERKAILDFYDIGCLKPTPLSGYEINTLIDSNTFCLIPKKR